jgi:hypothetical protein
MTVRHVSDLDPPPTDAEVRLAACDRARSLTGGEGVRRQLDAWFGVVREPEPAPPGDGTRAATALCVALVGLSVPFAAALTFADQPVAAVGGGLFAAGCALAALAVNGGEG